MRKTDLSRRHFLINGSAWAATLPFLPSLFCSEAEAAGTIRPRLVTLFTPNGQRQQYWHPRMSANVSFGAGRELPLSALSANGISPILGTAFNPYLNKMTLIQGLDHPVTLGHNNRAILGHYSDSVLFPTVDQVLAKSAKFYGGTTPLIDSLRFGDRFSYGYSGTSFTLLPSFSDVRGAFERVFGLGQPATLQKHASIVERTLSMYQKVAANPRLSAADKRLIDAQGTLITELKGRLNSIPPLTCTPPAQPAQPANNEQFFETAIDMIVASFLCGATQVANIGIDNPSPLFPSGNDWHGPSHTPESGNVESSLTINKWVAEKFFLRLIQKMDSITEANGKTMLDNSIVYWGNEISIGNGHSSENMPVLLAGSAGGRLRTGFIYDYRQMDLPDAPGDNAGSSNKPGRLYNQFLVTLLQAMGLSSSDYERNGIRGYGVNTSGSQRRNDRYTKFMSEIGNPLPRLWVG